MKIGLNYIVWYRGRDTHILQIHKGGPFYSIVRFYYSEDAGMNLRYTHFAIPRKYESEPPL